MKNLKNEKIIFNFRIKAKFVVDKKAIHSIHQADITMYKCAPNIKAPKYTKQILTEMKGEIDSNTIIAGEVNNPLSTMDRLSRQKINKEKLDLNHSLDQMNIIDIHATAPEYIF